MAKSNRGSNMPNQGDQNKSRRSSNTGSTPWAKTKVWKGKGKKNPPVPDWLH